MSKRSGEAWSLIRGTLRQKFSFGEIQDLVGASGFPVESVSNVRNSDKVALLKGIESVIERALAPEVKDAFVTACIAEMLLQKPEIRADLEPRLNRAGWTLQGTHLCPVNEGSPVLDEGAGTHQDIGDQGADLSGETLPIPFSSSRDGGAPILMTELRKNKNRIFIGHGHSLLWRELKDFLHEELGLEYEEFNREPTAGIPNVERLEQMLNSTSFAFIIMTAEDEHANGTKHARANVIHEAGLFQGRLGFRKAIILLEDGCQDFSNIAGLTHIPFPKNKIIACAEDIRRTLKREGVLGI